jgi:hypothetical protein
MFQPGKAQHKPTASAVEDQLTEDECHAFANAVTSIDRSGRKVSPAIEPQRIVLE